MDDGKELLLEVGIAQEGGQMVVQWKRRILLGSLVARWAEHF